MSTQYKTHPAIIGLDFGTDGIKVTLSTAQGVCPIRLGEKNQSIFPAALSLNENDKLLHGNVAKRRVCVDPEHSIYALKLLLGLRWDDLYAHHVRQHLQYSLIPSPPNNINVKLKSQAVTIFDLAAFLLSKVRERVEEQAGHSIDEVVMTCPVNYQEAQCLALYNLGRAAGFRYVELLHEAKAAALAYGFGQRCARTIAVCDWGTGTFDCSILRSNESASFDILGWESVLLLGDNIEDKVIRNILVMLRQHNQVSAIEDGWSMQRIVAAAEKVRHRLSTHLSTEINLPFFSPEDRNDAFHIQMFLSQSQLKQWLQDTLETVDQACRQACDKAGIDPQDIDDLILVGGHTCLPLVHAHASELFGREPCVGMDPRLTIALGAGLQGVSRLDEVRASHQCA